MLTQVRNLIALSHIDYLPKNWIMSDAKQSAMKTMHLLVEAFCLFRKKTRPILDKIKNGPCSLYGTDID